MMPDAREKIAIVAAGCVLPQALGIEAFEKIIFTGENIFSDDPGSRWNREVFLAAKPFEADRLATSRAGYIGDEIVDTIIAVDPQKRRSLTRSHWYVLGALDQIAGEVRKSAGNLALVLGGMGQDSATGDDFLLSLEPQVRRSLQGIVEPEEITRAYSAIFQRRAHGKTLFTDSIFESAFESIDRQGLAFITDAACASSLVAIQSACHLLWSLRADAVIAGGLEARLSPDNLFPFSVLGVQSKTNCSPFDQSATGLVPGEACVLFLLQRLSTAMQSGRAILGVIDHCEGRGNGSLSSLFSPSLERQRTLLAPLPANLDYLECHGTGTILGDKTEMKALQEAFSAAPPFAVGSSKSIFGHTLGAAGAVGLLQALTFGKHRRLAPHPYLENPIPELTAGPAYCNREAKEVPNDRSFRFGVNSSGFGGSNFHLRAEVADGYQAIDPSQAIEASLVVIARSRVTRAEGESDFSRRDFRIPPVSLPEIDWPQRASLLAVQRALESSLLPLKELERESIAVITASHSSTEQMERISRRVRLSEIINYFATNPEAHRRLRDLQLGQTPLTEESAGALNACISGRICGIYDWWGGNFHIDAKTQSWEVALLNASGLLTYGSAKVVVVIGIVESYGPSPVTTDRSAVNCLFLTRREEAERHHWPILEALSGFTASFEEPSGDHAS